VDLNKDANLKRISSWILVKWILWCGVCPSQSIPKAPSAWMHENDEWRLKWPIHLWVSFTLVACTKSQRTKKTAFFV